MRDKMIVVLFHEFSDVKDKRGVKCFDTYEQLFEWIRKYDACFVMRTTENDLEEIEERLNRELVGDEVLLYCGVYQRRWPLANLS